MADQHDLPRRVLVPYTDVFEQPHMYRIVKKRVEVEQDVDAGLGNCANVLEHIRGFGIHALWLQGDIEALQTVGHGPAKQWHVVGARGCDRDRLQYFEYASFILRFDHDDWRSGTQNDFEIVASVHRAA